MKITLCEKCGQKLVPKFGENGRTELACLWCDKLDSFQVEAAKWAESPTFKPTLPKAP
jgi:hypothetical protein